MYPTPTPASHACVHADPIVLLPLPIRAFTCSRLIDLAGGDVKGDGGHEERSPFATLLRQHFPSASFARSAASASDDASSGLSEYPAPVVVEGLPVSLARLCGLYRYAGQHEGRCFFECKASGYFAYFDPKDARWFVGPKLGDRNILCYKEVLRAHSDFMIALVIMSF